MAGGHSGSVGGGGGSGGSGRAQFRSQSGCCICGTKSSSSRFTVSVRYSEHFAGCFGQPASSRTGDLCNACVLCVKRWLQRNKPPGLFVQVLDSKKGPGPKHMKEITKRARRREARNANASARNAANSSTITATNHTSTNSLSHRISTSSNSGPAFATRCTEVDSSTLHTAVTHQNNNSTQHPGRTCGSYFSESNTCHSSITGPGSSTSLPSFQLNEFRRCGYRSSLAPYSLPSKSTGRHSGACGLPQETFCSPYPVGATFTRAAAAAIRKSEATENSTVDIPINLLSSTASETSEYGSGVFGQSSGCSSRCTTLDDAATGSGCSESSCGCTSSGYSGLGCSPCCAFCSLEMTPCKQSKRESISDGERHRLCRGCPGTGYQNVCHSSRSAHNSSPPDSGCCSATTRSHSSCCLSEFRYPPPPANNNASSRKRPTSTEEHISSGDTVQNSTIPSTRRYNRRVVLPPVRMTHNAEVNSLLREIMERNSQAISFDSREMHMAVQKELRLRSRTVQGNSHSGSASGRTSSISSVDGVSGSNNPISSDSNSLPHKCTSNRHVCSILTTRNRVQCCCARHHSHCCHMLCGCFAGEGKDGSGFRCGK